jgi:hypothetical protein
LARFCGKEHGTGKSVVVQQSGLPKMHGGNTPLIEVIVIIAKFK